MNPEINPSDHEQTLSLEQVLDVLRRRWGVILLCFVLVTGAAFVFSKHQTKKYTATASLVFNNNQLNQQVAGLVAVSSGTQQSEQSTNVKLIELGETANRTALLLGHHLTGKAIRDNLAVNAEGESSIVDVKATSTSPKLAAQIANTYSDQFVKGQDQANHLYFTSALTLVEKQLAALSKQQRAGSQGLALQDRAQSLDILSELSGNVQVAQAATIPTGPSSPKVSRNTALGAMLGLLLGLGIAFLLERLDRRIREPKDLEAIYHLPLLGVVPESAALAGADGVSGGSANVLPSGDAEVFRMLRAHLRYFNVDRNLHTLLVASAAPGDGKTTVTRHLAAAAATMGSRVLLMETDLRRPTLASKLSIPSGKGLAGVLIGAVPFEEAIQSIDLGPPQPDGSPARAMHVLTAGVTVPPNPAELIESHAMEALLERVKGEYDLVLIDTPPLTAVSDTFPLLHKVDGVIIVARLGRNRRDVARRLYETLSGVGAPLLGVVANGFKAGGLRPYSYNYAYSYSYTNEDERAKGNGTIPPTPVPAPAPPEPSRRWRE